MKEQIRALAKAKNAVIMAHYYCRLEVQEVADFIGDSLALAQQAQKTDADIIVMCGVHFMAETAAILCPDKKVLIPDATAGCSLADSCRAADLAAWKAQHPQHKVISYVNTSAEVKALSDIVVTSSNALKIVNSFPQDTPLLFGPDCHLGAYINAQTGRTMELWNGGCHVHSRFSEDSLLSLKREHPTAAVLAHPECPQNILDHSDVIGSTAALLHYVQNHPEQSEFIVVTEPGVIYKMQEAHPSASFYPVLANDSTPSSKGCLSCNTCEYMRQNTLQNVLACLQNERPVVTVDASIAQRALLPIHRMLSLS